jgi:hypothetical protein
MLGTKTGRLALAMTLAATLTAAACASTAQQRTAVGSGATADAGLAGTADTTSSGEAATGGTDETADGASRSGRSASGAAARAGPRTGQATQAVGAKPTGPIEIGILVAENASAAYGQLGIKGAEIGDSKGQAEAVVRDLNSRGGILGRKITPIYAALDPTSTETLSAQYQYACSSWTEDHRVVAAATALNLISDVLFTCLSKRHVPLVFVNLSPVPRVAFTQSALIATPAAPNQDRLMDWYVDGLARQNYFAAPSAARPTKIGVMLGDVPVEHQVVKDSLMPALARHGLSITDQAAITPAETLDQSGPSLAQIQNATLKFASDNITHVLFLDSGAALAVYFMTSAESAHYRPRYGLTSYSAPNFLTQNVPLAQLVGSVGVGWWPVYDVNDANDPGRSGPAKRCLEMMRAAGQDVSTRSVVSVALSYCDALYTLAASFVRGNAVTPDGFVNGVGGLGSFETGITFSTRFAPGRRDGAATIRYVAYDNGACQCFRYTTGNLEP